jgi:hypothetical protein
MGGIGSGKWHRWNTKETTEGLRALDVRYLHSHGMLKPGHVFHLQWSRNGEPAGSISFVTGDDQITLLFNVRSAGQEEWEQVKEPIQLDWTPCYYGGRRPWLLCPGRCCGRRVAVLYGASRYFLCRHCYQLTYATCNMETGDRLREKAQKIRERLGGSASLMALFPGKPKGMHDRTYLRLFWEAQEAEMASLVAMQEHIDRMRSWIDKHTGE